MEREARNKTPYCSICAGIGKLCLNSGSWDISGWGISTGAQPEVLVPLPALAGLLGTRSTTGKKGANVQERWDPRKNGGIRCMGAELATQCGTGAAVSAGHSEQCRRQRGCACPG